MRDDLITTTFTKSEFIRKGGKMTLSVERRPSVVFPRQNRPKDLCDYSFMDQLGQTSIKKRSSLEQCRKIFDEMPENALMVVIHPTRFCCNARCGRPSSYFIDRHREGHSTCTKCGTVQRLAQNNFSLRLNDDGDANKSAWEVTPGMTARDCTITTRKGQRIGHKIKSHQRNLWRIKGKVEGIANEWHFEAMESLIRRGKNILTKLYYRIHNDDHSDNPEGKLPHGGAAIAAACFYCAVLEFEQRVKFKTPCTLPAIRESAQSCRDHKTGRTCRDVTDVKILRYARMMKKQGLTPAHIPDVSAETLSFHPKSAALQHSRMALFGECNPTKFHLPIADKWGIKVGDTEQGVLYIDNCAVGSCAWSQGIRKGDYIFQLEGETVNCDCTPKKFEQKIINAKQCIQHKSVIELAVMRKKGSQKK
jgi:hypothetical protein